MTAKTMAEVLAEHEDCAFSASGILACSCGVALEPNEVMDDLSNLATHQADVLSAAGFGLVADAKAEAWEECQAARYEIRLEPGGKYWQPYKDNPYRAAS